MPRFFFHLRTAHKSLMDCEGMVLADAAAARRQAMLTVRDFVQPSLGRVDPDWQDWSIDVGDDRGRRVFTMAVADAEELDQADPQAAEERASPRIVYLNLERAKREFASLEHQTRNLVRRAAMLVDRNRYEAKSLYHLMKATEEARRRSVELLARSRHQTASSDWRVTETAIG